MKYIDTLLGTLNSMRSAETLKKLYDEAFIIAEQLGVTLCKQRIAARSVYRMAGGENEDTESYSHTESFYHTAPAMWNRLPSEFRQLAPLSSTSPLAISPTLFHKKLNTHLFHSYFPP